jgi:hypothetical protein
VDSYFKTLNAIVNERKVSNRIRFKIQDVVDLRKNGWENPRTYRERKVFKDGDHGLDSLRSQNSGTFSIVNPIHWFF